jgi:2-polyprenyl-3-methyl-5-hydroxy-6-metoxy-1,4-benzoquinol methylase
MIVHKLIARHIKHGDDEVFYRLQARDALDWMAANDVSMGKGATALDLGCGHGIFGAELMKRGCSVTFADEENTLLPEVASAPYRKINIDRDDLGTLGTFDLVVCSNVLEHLALPEQFLRSVHAVINQKGILYLSWTNWLSPWGGHEFSPFHYLGPKRGHLIFDKLRRRGRKHTPFENLFPTYIGSIIRQIRANPNLQIVRIAPRYYTELSFLAHLPLLREFLTWNCAVLIRRV